MKEASQLRSGLEGVVRSSYPLIIVNNNDFIYNSVSAVIMLLRPGQAAAVSHRPRYLLFLHKNAFRYEATP